MNNKGHGAPDGAALLMVLALMLLAAGLAVITPAAIAILTSYIAVWVKYIKKEERVRFALLLGAALYIGAIVYYAMYLR